MRLAGLCSSSHDALIAFTKGIITLCRKKKPLNRAELLGQATAALREGKKAKR